jgi:hypothetical protein
MYYLPTILITVLFLALLSAQLIKNDMERAQLTFLFMILVSLIVFMVNHLTSPTMAWILMSIFIILTVLFSVIRSDIMDIPKITSVNTCKEPVKDECMPEPKVDECSGSSEMPEPKVDECSTSNLKEIKKPFMIGCMNKCIKCGSCELNCDCLMN